MGFQRDCVPLVRSRADSPCKAFPKMLSAICRTTFYIIAYLNVLVKTKKSRHRRTLKLRYRFNEDDFQKALAGLQNSISAICMRIGTSRTILCILYYHVKLLLTTHFLQIKWTKQRSLYIFVRNRRLFCLSCLNPILKKHHKTKVIMVLLFISLSLLLFLSLFPLLS